MDTLVETLRFYANSDNYHWSNKSSRAPVLDDGGAKARKALANLEHGPLGGDYTCLQCGFRSTSLDATQAASDLLHHAPRGLCRVTGRDADTALQ